MAVPITQSFAVHRMKRKCWVYHSIESPAQKKAIQNNVALRMVIKMMLKNATRRHEGDVIAGTSEITSHSNIHMCDCRPSNWLILSVQSLLLRKRNLLGTSSFFYVRGSGFWHRNVYREDCYDVIERGRMACDTHKNKDSIYLT